MTAASTGALVIAPLEVGMNGETRVEVAALIGDFATNPRWQHRLLVLICQFYLCYHQPLIVAVKNIDFPDVIEVGNPVAGFFDQRVLAKLQQLPRVGRWNG